MYINLFGPFAYYTQRGQTAHRDRSLTSLFFSSKGANEEIYSGPLSGHRDVSSRAASVPCGPVSPSLSLYLTRVCDNRPLTVLPFNPGISLSYSVRMKGPVIFYSLAFILLLFFCSASTGNARSFPNARSLIDRILLVASITSCERNALIMFMLHHSLSFCFFSKELHIKREMCLMSFFLYIWKFQIGSKISYLRLDAKATAASCGLLSPSILFNKSRIFHNLNVMLVLDTHFSCCCCPFP